MLLKEAKQILNKNGYTLLSEKETIKKDAYTLGIDDDWDTSDIFKKSKKGALNASIKLCFDTEYKKLFKQEIDEILEKSTTPVNFINLCYKRAKKYKALWDKLFYKIDALERKDADVPEEFTEKLKIYNLMEEALLNFSDEEGWLGLLVLYAKNIKKVKSLIKILFAGDFSISTAKQIENSLS